MNSKKDIFAAVFWIIIIILTIYISGIIAGITTLLLFFVYTILTYVIYIIWKKIRKDISVDIVEYIRLFAYKTALSLSIVALFFGGFVYYNNEIAPASMPTHYLSNTQKQVTFQAMIHIANPEFYSTVEQDILFAKQDNYVYFFEWVKPGSQQSHDAFNEAIWVEFDADLYKNFSELYWVVAQDNSQFLGLHNDLDFNIDMDMDQIMQLYQQKVSTSQQSQSKIPAEVLDVNTEIITLLSELSPRQKKILVYVNQAMLNFFTKNEALRNTILKNLWNQDIFSVILDERNKIIADAIINSPHKKIHITYGLLHFEGVFELLKQNDPAWRLHHSDYLFPIQ